jgi:hypothetical protein
MKVLSSHTGMFAWHGPMKSMSPHIGAACAGGDKKRESPIAANMIEDTIYSFVFIDLMLNYALSHTKIKEPL